MQIVLGASYRAYVKVADHFGIKTKECWQVDRGGGLPIVWSCEGLGDPSYFYINGVWVFAGMAAALIFVFGYFLSQSIIGGLLSAVCFFFNHGEVIVQMFTHSKRVHFAMFTVYTRSMDTPIARKLWISADISTDSNCFLVLAPKSAPLEALTLRGNHYSVFASHMAVFSVRLPNTSHRTAWIVVPTSCATSNHNRSVSWKTGKILIDDLKQND